MLVPLESWGMKKHLASEILHGFLKYYMAFETHAF